MNDEQLLEFSPEQARQQLNDEQLERYNELQEKSLTENIEDQKEADTENAVNGLEAMRQQVEKELTVDVYGIEFVADVNPKQVKKLNDLKKFQNKDPDELQDEEFSNVHGSFLDLLSELSVSHTRKDWESNFGDAGIKTLAKITGNLLSKIDVELEQKKSR